MRLHIRFGCCQCQLCLIQVILRFFLCLIIGCIAGILCPFHHVHLGNCCLIVSLRLRISIGYVCRIIIRLRQIHVIVRLISRLFQIVLLILKILPILFQLHHLVVNIVNAVVNPVNLHLHLIHGQILLSLGLLILDVELRHCAVILRLRDLVSHLGRLYTCRRAVILGLRTGQLELRRLRIEFT